MLADARATVIRPRLGTVRNSIRNLDVPARGEGQTGGGVDVAARGHRPPKP